MIFNLCQNSHIIRFLPSPEQLFATDPIRSAFTYELANGNFCSSAQPDALLFVVSKSANAESRNAIRRTWGNLARLKSQPLFSHLHVRLLFLLDVDDTLMTSMKLEQRLFHDLVQVHLPQYYTLSSYRDMAILYWTETYCPNAKITVKTDDDVFLNTYLLANVLNSLLANMTSDLSRQTCDSEDTSGRIYGILIMNALVVRLSTDPVLEANRYIVTDDEYPCKYYPHYMSGFGYLVDYRARSKLLCGFFRDPKPFFMSDVYVTGVLPDYLGIERQHLGLLISYRSTDDCEQFFRQTDPDSFACASSLHYSTSKVNIFERFNAYWQRIHEHRLLYIQRKFPPVSE